MPRREATTKSEIIRKSARYTQFVDEDEKLKKMRIFLSTDLTDYTEYSRLVFIKLLFF
jgi:hypothetical protein